MNGVVITIGNFDGGSGICQVIFRKNHRYARFIDGKIKTVFGGNHQAMIDERASARLPAILQDDTDRGVS